MTASVFIKPSQADRFDASSRGPCVAHQYSTDFQVQVLTTLARHDEKFDSINQKFDAIDQKFDGINKKFESIDAKFEVINAKFEGINKQFEGINEKFESIKTSIAALSGTVGGLSSELKNLQIWKYKVWGMVILAGWLVAAGAGAWALVGSHISWNANVQGHANTR